MPTELKVRGRLVTKIVSPLTSTGERYIRVCFLGENMNFRSKVSSPLKN
jgi:hypothetical protein